MRLSKDGQNGPQLSEENMMGIILLIVAVIALATYALFFEIKLLVHLAH